MLQPPLPFRKENICISLSLCYPFSDLSDPIPLHSYCLLRGGDGERPPLIGLLSGKYLLTIALSEAFISLVFFVTPPVLAYLFDMSSHMSGHFVLCVGALLTL